MIYTHDLRKTLKARQDLQKHCGPYQWKPSEPGRGRGFYQSTDGLWMDRAGSTLDLRLELAGKHANKLETEFWADPHGFNSFTPIIARLPHGRGYLAGWTMGEGMCASLELERYDDIKEAAYAAFRLAEYTAEREYDCLIQELSEEGDPE